MIGVAVRQHLMATDAVTDLCRFIYPNVIPLGQEAPAIVYGVDSDERDRTLGGQGSYRMARVALDVYAPKYDDAQAIADALESALVDFRGALGAASLNIEADHVRQERRTDLYENTTDYHRVSMQFFIGYEMS